MFKKIMVVLLLLLTMSPAKVLAEEGVTYTEGTLYYTIEDGSITITGCFGKNEVITIPAAIAGTPVNTVAAKAFTENSYVKEVILPDTIMTVEEGAFGSGINVVFGSEKTEGPGNDNGPGTNDPNENNPGTITPGTSGSDANVGGSNINSSTSNTDSNGSISSDQISNSYGVNSSTSNYPVNNPGTVQSPNTTTNRYEDDVVVVEEDAAFDEAEASLDEELTETVDKEEELANSYKDYDLKKSSFNWLFVTIPLIAILLIWGGYFWSRKNRDEY